MTRKTLIVAGVLVLAAFIVGGAYAENDNSTIHACVNPAGKIRIVEGPEECTPQETYLDWNNVGLQGLQGEPGPSGADGTSCSVTQYEGYAEILCDDGYSATIIDGQDGQQGPPGPPGYSQFVPVGCKGEAYGGGTFSIFLECYAADGTLFTDNERVPNGFLFMITDVLVTRKGHGGETKVTLYDAYDISSRGDSLPIWKDEPMTSEHFTTPFLILSAGHRLEADYGVIDAENFHIRVSGLLVDEGSWP